jgi:hypothetical protein
MYRDILQEQMKLSRAKKFDFCSLWNNVACSTADIVIVVLV